MRSRIVYHGADAPKKGRKIPWVLPALAGGAIVLAAAGIVYAIRLPALQVHRITMTGIETLEEAALRRRIGEGLAGEYLWVLPRSSFLFVRSAEVKADLEREFPRIREAHVEKEFPDAMNIAISERPFWGVFCSTEQSSTTPACAYIDPSGVAYARSPEPEGRLIIVVRSDRGSAVLGSAVLEQGLMGQIREIADALEEKADVPVAGFVVSSRVPGEIRAVAAEGFTMIFARENNIKETVSVFRQVLDGEIGDRRAMLDYVDLRLGNKVFYKLK